MSDEQKADAPKADAAAPRLVPKGLERRHRMDPLLVAGAASVAWLVVIGAYAVGFFAGAAQPPAPQPQALSVMLFLLGGLGPVALLMLGGALLTQLQALRAELTQRNTAPTATSGADETARHARRAAQISTTLLTRLEAIEAQLATLAAGPVAAPSPSLATHRATNPPQAAPTDQAELPLDEQRMTPVARVPWNDILRALDFPRDAQDTRGFDAVRSALRDPETARLLQAAEDVLTILAGDGLHMEDFTPDHASLHAWRSYADGSRGDTVAALAGIQDDTALEQTHTRLRSDPIFRDAALVFIRRWNGLLTRIVNELGEDAALRDAADTRSGRAFMLLASAMGVFGPAE